ncbi:DnaJ domain containing protein [Parasponia andersonii]|uniref:DnaJ domain containing protein n=1 Tax=Parasponia andersonii TaxID=3476 RepID=A0A2P5A7X5_PARAD|nr:DnaJ domain containing protein [Parasponia andersonii]
MAEAKAGSRCHYKVLGVRRECSGDEIRSAYERKRMKLQPDKAVLRCAGVSEAEATAKYLELIQACKVLSNPRERAIYDYQNPDSSDTTEADSDSLSNRLLSLCNMFHSRGYSEGDVDNIFRSIQWR